MRKDKKIVNFLAVFAFFVGLLLTGNLTAKASETDPMLHFSMTVRWGNVIDEPTNTDETDFSGSVSVSSDSRISLERTLLFDSHKIVNGVDYDSLASSTATSISWNSYAYNHWDGVKVAVSAPSSSKVVIDTKQGKVEKTAQEFYDTKDPIVQDVGNGKEIVIKTYPATPNPSYFLKVFWGKIERDGYGAECTPATDAAASLCKTPLLNADGSFKIDSAGTLKLIKTLRFEYPDKITSKSDSQIDWVSRLYGGIDGVLVKLKLDAAQLDKSDTVTIDFTNHKDKFPKSYSIVDLYHNGLTKDVITSDGYGVALQVWKRPNKSLIRVSGTPTVYMLEDGVKQPIQSPAVLASQGLSFSDVEEVSGDEAEIYENGDPVNYADGTIVREEDRPEVYVIANGEKKHILDPKAFGDLGYNWGNIVVVPSRSLGIFRTSSAMKSDSIHPEGALIRYSGAPTVYVVEGGKKVPISDIQLFNARKYDWNKVLVINKNQLDKYEQSTLLKYPDGSLLKSPDGKVYKIDGEKKRWVRTVDDFHKAGYKSNKILNVSTSEINSFEEGTDVMVDDVT